MIQILVLIGSLAALVAARRHRRHRPPTPARAVIVSPRRSTVIAEDGAVRSAQSAKISCPRDELTRLWTGENLENLAATYWRFLSRVTLGIVRVVYGVGERRVVLIAQPLTLLRFESPDYLLEPGHGKVSWRIKGGLLVARRGRGAGYLALDVTRLQDDEVSGQGTARIEVEVANFYPSIATGFSTPVYEATQSALHVLVTHAFLRSLARLELARSRVGRLRAEL